MTQEIWQAACDLLTQAFSSHRGVGAKNIRLIEVGVSGLDQSRDVQPLLFQDPEQQRRVKHKDLDRLTDAVRERFGNAALKRACVKQVAKRKPSAE